MEIRPLHDRVIVKRLEEERKTAGGIVIPDTAAEKPSQGQVVYAGPGKTDDNGKLVPMGVKTGDKILFGKYSGQEFKLNGQDLLHMREDDIIGIVGLRQVSVGEYIASSEAAILRDATTTTPGVRIYTIRPVHNPIGPFDFSGGFDDRSHRSQPLDSIRGFPCRVFTVHKHAAP